MAAQLQPAYAFGVKSDVGGAAVGQPDDGVLLYASGGHLVKFTASSRSQELVPLGCGGSGGAGATALALSRARRFVAVGEAGGAARARRRPPPAAEAPTGAPPDASAPPTPDGDGASPARVSLFATRTMQRRRAVAVGDALRSDRVVSLDFSADDALVLAVGGRVLSPLPAEAAPEAVAPSDASVGSSSRQLTAPRSDRDTLTGMPEAATPGVFESQQPYIALVSADTGAVLVSLQLAPPRGSISAPLPLGGSVTGGATGGGGGGGLFSSRNLRASSRQLHSQQAALAAQQRALADAPTQLRGGRFNGVPPTAAQTPAPHAPCCRAVVFGDRALAFYTVTASSGSGGGSTSGDGAAAAPAAEMAPLPQCARLADWLARYGPASPHVSFRCAEWLGPAACVVGTGAGDLLLFTGDSGGGGGLELSSVMMGASAAAGAAGTPPERPVSGGGTTPGDGGGLLSSFFSGGSGSAGGGGGGSGIGGSRTSRAGGSSGPPSAEAILLRPRASTAAGVSGSPQRQQSDGTGGGDASSWDVAVAGAGGVVRLYRYRRQLQLQAATPAAASEPRSSPSSSPQPSALGMPASADTTVAATADGAFLALVATASLPQSALLELDNVTVTSLSSNPSGSRLVAVVAGCHLFALQPDKAVAAAAAVVATSTATGAAAHGDGGSAAAVLLEPVAPLSHSGPVSSGCITGGDGLYATGALGAGGSSRGSGGGGGGATSAAAALAPPPSAILSMDVAVRRPLVATLGVGGALRVWNFHDRRCEVARSLPDGPVGVSLHPRCVGGRGRREPQRRRKKRAYTFPQPDLHGRSLSLSFALSPPGHTPQRPGAGGSVPRPRQGDGAAGGRRARDGVRAGQGRVVCAVQPRRHGAGGGGRPGGAPAGRRQPGVPGGAARARGARVAVGMGAQRRHADDVRRRRRRVRVGRPRRQAVPRVLAQGRAADWRRAVQGRRHRVRHGAGRRGRGSGG
jgi:hypothetical protein